MLKLKDESLLRRQNFINGSWVDGGAGSIDVTNPANGEVVVTTANGDAADAERAVESAAAAFKTWSRVPARQRAVLLRNWFNLLMENTDDLTDTNDRRFTRNEQYFVNTWYSLSKPLKVGAEYIYIETERHEQIHSGNRFTVSMQYAF